MRSAPSSGRGSVTVASGILVSRITGLARERALGHFLGTSAAADAFTAAFRIPNLLQHLLGEGVLSASFIPVYSRLLAEGRHQEASRVAGAVGGLVAVAAGLLALVGLLLATPLTLLVAPGLRARPETFELTVSLVQVLFPATGLLVLSAWCLAVLNSHRRFFLSYVAPSVLNLVQIAVLVGAGLSGVTDDLGRAAAQERLVVLLSLGTVVGGLLQFLVQLPTVLRLARGVRPSLRTDLPGVRETLRAFLPVVAGRGVVQVSAYAQVVLASFLAAGALSSLRYAQILYLLPVSLFGMSVAAAELPELSREGAQATSVRRLQTGLARIAFFVLPTTVGYLVVGDLITGALFQTGEFGRLQSVGVAFVLGGYALGLVATTSSRLLQSALYGTGDPRTPARVAAVRVAVSLGLGAVLMLQLDQVAVGADGVRLLGDLPATGLLSAQERQAAGDDVLRLGAVGLAVASGVAAWVEYVLLRRAVTRRIGPTSLAGGRLRPLLLATAAAGGAALVLRPLLLELPVLLGGTAAVVVVAGVHVAVSSALGVDDLQPLLRRLRRRTRRR